MKYLFPLLMIVAVVIGFGSALTPMIAELLVPVPNVMVKKAEPKDVAEALHQWFVADPKVKFTETQALNRSDDSGRVSWMTFKVDPKTVSRFIHMRGLQQKDLNQDVLNDVFSQGKVPADWWDPAELTRETWFSGTDSGRDIGLIYNAQWQKGYLVARSRS